MNRSNAESSLRQGRWDYFFRELDQSGRSAASGLAQDFVRRHLGVTSHPRWRLSRDPSCSKQMAARELTKVFGARLGKCPSDKTGSGALREDLKCSMRSRRKEFR